MASVFFRTVKEEQVEPLPADITGKSDIQYHDDIV